MTYREYAERYRPNRVSNQYVGGVCGCPGSIIDGALFSDIPGQKMGPGPCRVRNSLGSCAACWDQEIPDNLLPKFDPTESSPDKNSPAGNDPVNHPSHYTQGGIECIDAIRAALGSYTDPVDAWLVGQVIKYLWRAPLKGKYDEDIRKAQFYLNRLVKKDGDDE